MKVLSFALLILGAAAIRLSEEPAKAENEALSVSQTNTKYNTDITKAKEDF